MIRVYTNSELFKSNDNLEVNSYSNLSDSFVSWIEKTIKSNNEKSTEPEREFKRILESNNAVFEYQTFFRINNKNYFLDFFLPEINIAIEVNGTSHVKNVDYDFARDKDFESIGIKTIRISNRDVYDRNIFEKLNRYIKLALNGVSDVTNYFNLSTENTIKNKLTYNQKALYCAIEGIKKCKKCSRVLIKTDMTYILGVLRREILSNETPVVNIDFVRYFFMIVDEKKIEFDILYEGCFDNLKGYIGTLARKSKESDFISNNNCIIKVTKEEIDSHKRLSYSKTMAMLAECLNKYKISSGVYQIKNEPLVVMGDNVVIYSSKLKNGDTRISFYNVKSADDIQKLKEGKLKIDSSEFHVSILIRDLKDFDRLLNSINQMKSLI